MWKIKQVLIGPDTGKYYAYKFTPVDNCFNVKYYGSPDNKPQYFDDIEVLRMILDEGGQTWVERLRKLQNA